MTVSVERFGTGPRRTLAGRVDVDGSGGVSRAEFEAAKTAVESGDSAWADAKPEWEGFSKQYGAEAGSTAAATPAGKDPITGASSAAAGAGADVSGDRSRLNAAQAEAIRRVTVTAEAKAKEARPALLAKFTAMGLTEADLDKTLAWLREKASITINFNPDKTVKPSSYWLSSAGGASATVAAATSDDSTVLDELLADGEYLDQFITGISGGSGSAYAGGSRDNWEKTIFQGAYHENPMVPGERPQYGALNAMALAQGSASSYGSCYLVLKQGVKQRATFTPSDSSGARADDVGTIEHMEHVLNKTSLDLKKIAAAALERPELADTRASYWGYLEGQVHGTIEFHKYLDLSKDIEAVVMNTSFKGTPYEDKARAFAEKFGCELKWHDGKTVTPDVPPAPAITPDAAAAATPPGLSSPTAP